MSDEDLPECYSIPQEDDGFVDLNLCLVQLEAKSDGGVLAIGNGKHEKKTVGLALELDPAWKKTPVPDTDQFFFWGNGAICSIGKESDRFLLLISKLYGTPSIANSMNFRTKVAIVGLANDPRDIFEKPTRMKLFFEHEDPKRYAEVFVNMIAPEGRFEFHEKDPGYREPLIHALAAKRRHSRWSWFFKMLQPRDG